MSCVIGPPESCIVFGSCRVRSPLMASHESPPLVLFQTRCDVVYSTDGSA